MCEEDKDTDYLIIDKMEETNMEESKHLMLEIPKKQNIPLC